MQDEARERQVGTWGQGLGGYSGGEPRTRYERETGRPYEVRSSCGKPVWGEPSAQRGCFGKAALETAPFWGEGGESLSPAGEHNCYQPGPK